MNNSEYLDCVLPDAVLQEANDASMELFPQKSKHRYDKEYTQFQRWCTKNNLWLKILL